MALTARSLPRGIRALAGGVVAALLLCTGATSASAEPPARLDEQITDSVGALAGDFDDVRDAVVQLQSDQGVQLWVAYVDTFDGMSGVQWTEATAQLSGLGGNDMLFAVATGDRAYGYTVADPMPVSDAELAQIMADVVEPELIADDWGGATIALANALDEPSGSGSAWWLWLLVGALVLGGGAFLIARSRRGKDPGDTPVADQAADPTAAEAEAESAPAPIEQVRFDAAAALIEADDSIRASEQELGFARAQFDDAATAPFVAVLEQARADLTRAFALQRSIDEAEGQDTEREVLEQIISLCLAADARLDDQVEHFDELRDMERRIDEILPSLAERAASLQVRLQGSTSVADEVRVRFSGAALQTVRGNLDQAADRIRFAVESVQVGHGLLAESDRQGAVARARAAEEALGQAHTLLDSVDRAPEELAQAQVAVAALLEETAKDIAEAESLGATANLSESLRYARETLDWARSAVASGEYDPAATRRALEDSDGALEAGLAPLRAAEEARRRADALLASTVDGARASIRAAGDFITTRRGAVGAQARTRLAEAERQFAAGIALAESDPATALPHLQTADQVADQALALAQQDEAHYLNSQRMRGGTSSLTNMMMGGILLDSMTRGSGRSRGRGRRSTGGGRSPSSFGGGASRARRGGGGRF